MVVSLHVQRMLQIHAEVRGYALTEFTAIPLGAGVYLFFVISDFIILYASERLFAGRSSARLRRQRLIRILPLYWLASAVQLASLTVGHALRQKAMPSALVVATSLFFMPYDSHGFGPVFPFPVLDLGWSLNYEMLFYLLFATFIVFERTRAVICISAILAITVAAGAVAGVKNVALHFWTQPLVLEFIAGMWIALLLRRGRTLTGPAAVGLVVAAGLLWLVLDKRWFGLSGGPGSYSWLRVVAWSLGAVGIVVGVALGPPGRSRMIGLLGNSSDALYLDQSLQPHGRQNSAGDGACAALDALVRRSMPTPVSADA